MISVSMINNVKNNNYDIKSYNNHQKIIISIENPFFLKTDRYRLRGWLKEESVKG